MRYVKYVFDFYLNASIHVALSVYALSWITLLLFEVSYNEDLLYFNFYGTITGYNFVKYFGVARWHHRSLTRWLKITQIFSLLCFILMCYYLFNLNDQTQIIIIFLGLITFFYAIPFIPKRFYMDTQKNLRSISGLKVYVIALVWSGVTVLLPVLEHNIYFNTNDMMLTVFQRFIYVIVLLFPFEIRDLKYDSLKLATIPQKIGVVNTKIIGGILLILFFLIEFFKDIVTIENNLINGILCIATLLFLLYSKKAQGRYYSSFFVEGLPILWLLLIFMFS